MPNYLYTTKATGIEYFERAEYRERWSSGANELTRTVGCRWSDRYALIRDFLGYAKPVSDRLNRFLPEFHPEYNWMPCLSMNMVNAEGYADDDSGKLGFQFHSGEGLAVFQATHANVPYRLLPDNEVQDGEWERWVQITETYQTESQQIAGGVWEIVGSDPVEVIQEPTTIPFFTKQVKMRWFATPLWVRERIEGCLNKVNETAFPGVFHGNVVYDYAPETLLMTGFEFEEQRSAAGDITYNLSFDFLWRAQTWNRFFRRNGPGNQGPGYYSVVDRDTGNPPYASAEMRDLFDLSLGFETGVLLP